MDPLWLVIFICLAWQLGRWANRRLSTRGKVILAGIIFCVVSWYFIARAFLALLGV